MRLQIIVILLAVVGIATGLAQLGDEQITITVTSEGKTKISQTLFPKTFVSTVDVHIISEKISNLLAIDEKDILLGTTQNEDLLKIATLGASTVDLKYNADVLTYESGVFKLNYNSELESRVNLPPLAKLVSLNTIPIAITDNEYILPPGDISLSYSIRPVTSKEFFVTVENSEQKIEAITAAKIEEFSANADEIQFIIKDKAIVLTIIPKLVMANPNDALLNGEAVDFTQFHQNSTHSWVRIDPHEKGLVKILDTNKKEGGGCLIATATYGSEMAPQVQFLREIRDNQLMNSAYGASFMTGFNQLYYSFSPTVADLEREHPFFKEFVKIAITPLLSTLSIMSFADSENEILGFGVGVIIINIGMYIVLPFVILYYVKRNLRTIRTNKANCLNILNCNVSTIVKTSLYGIIALLVLSVSVSSAFVESAYAEDEDPIRMVLDITYQNILDSRDSVDEIPEASETFFLAGEEKYQEAIAALEEGDVVTAKESALVAMALFENAAEEIGALEDQASTQLPPGLGAGIGSASDTGITNGQGLGVGGIPPGILKQVTAANIFEIQEEITDIDDEVNELRGLIESNGLNVNLDEYNESINLAKEVLANGEIPDAQAKLALAKEIKDNLYDQINAAVAEKQDERVDEFVENSKNAIEEMLANGENLGLTKKAISELESVLEAIENGETDTVLEKTQGKGELAKELDNPGEDETEDKPGNSENAPGQNKEEIPGNSGNVPEQNSEDGPGNSENAPGQNRGNDEAELPPGFESASDTGVANANGQGLGIGKVPPGLAKLFGLDETQEDGETPEGLPPGFGAAGDNPSENANGQGLGLGNIPPGQLKKLDYGEFVIYSPDDYFEDPIDDLAEDTFEGNYDKLYKESKAKEKKDKAAGKANAQGNTGGGNPHCNNEGVTDNDPTKTSGAIGVPYVVDGFTAVGSSCKVADPSQILIQVTTPPPMPFVENLNQGESFTPTTAETYTITASFQGQFITREVIVTSSNTPPTITSISNDFAVDEGTSGHSLSATVSDPDTGDTLTYSWTFSGQGPITVTMYNEDTLNPTFDVSSFSGTQPRDITFELSVSDGVNPAVTDTVVVTVNQT